MDMSVPSHATTFYRLQPSLASSNEHISHTYSLHCSNFHNEYRNRWKPADAVWGIRGKFLRRLSFGSRHHKHLICQSGKVRICPHPLYSSGAICGVERVDGPKGAASVRTLVGDGRQDAAGDHA